LLLLLLGVAPNACTAGRGSVRHARLNHGFFSKEALAEGVIKALSGGDLQSLKDMALSRDEFERCVWPEMPASNPRTNLTLDYVWNDEHARSARYLAMIFERYRGKKMRLVRVIQRGPTTEYRSHKAYSDMTAIARDESGKEMEYPLFGTLIELDGVWKVYSYAPYD
jgi:hypothetical protein